MRRVIFGTILGLMWAGAPVRAGHEHGGGHGGGGHPAHVGSIHFAPRPAAVHIAPVVTVRPAVRPIGGGYYRNPYRDEYFRRFRPGYFPLYLGGAQYYGYYSLPFGCPPVFVNGVTYYLCDGIYYQPYIYGGQTVYLVVPPL